MLDVEQAQHHQDSNGEAREVKLHGVLIRLHLLALESGGPAAGGLPPVKKACTSVTGKLLPKSPSQESPRLSTKMLLGLTSPCSQPCACNVVSGGGSNAAVYNCTMVSASVVDARASAPVSAATNATGVSVCKGGPPLPMDPTRSDVLWIGDSLSLGMIPHVASNLSDIALVQHAPWGGDGGAEETAYGLNCREFFLSSPSGMSITPSLNLV